MGMRYSFSPLTLDVLTDVITGGSANDPTPSIGIYRSAWYLKEFMRTCGERFEVEGSRVASFRQKLSEIEFVDDSGRQLVKLFEHAADPRHYLADPQKATAVVEHLNQALQLDGYELVRAHGKPTLCPLGARVAVVGAFAEKSTALNFETVSRDIERALSNADLDPEDAVTAACSTLEAVCRSILVELAIPLPAKKDLTSLVRAVQEPLDLSPGRSDLPPDIADDIRQVLSGLTTTAKGIGALRTHGGDAHGRERGRKSVDARVARLAIHASSTLALFLIETWERKQKRALPVREVG